MRLIDKTKYVKIVIILAMLPLNMLFPLDSKNICDENVTASMVNINVDKIVMPYADVVKLIISKRIKDTLKVVLSDFGDCDANINKLSVQDIYAFEVSRREIGFPIDVYYRLVYKESEFNPDALSCMGAMGYFQIMRDAYNDVRADSNHVYLPPYEDQTKYDNIVAGSLYLKKTYDNVNCLYKFDSREDMWKYVLASYNAGLSNAGVAMEGFLETREYIKKIMHRVSA